MRRLANRDESNPFIAVLTCLANLKASLARVGAASALHAPRAGLFARSRQASVAVEFALLALPFSLLIFAILETSVAYVAQQAITNATDDIARQLRTGVLKSSDVSGGKLKQILCARIPVLITQDCNNQLLVDLESYSSFDKVPTTIPFTSTGDIDTSGFKVAPGDTLSINQLRVFYRWPVMTDIMRQRISNLPNGKTLLYATDTWQNEPY